ncbi:MAG: hypothetical protein ACKO9B_17235 [Planctomycetota bacterium]|nr:hypothetical protein [Planctomycetota bacterium]
MADPKPTQAPSNPGEFDPRVFLFEGAWLPFLPAFLREPVARLAVFAAVAATVMLGVAPVADDKGEAWLEASFARTLAALAATRALDSAISLAQSSEVSFSFGPGGSLGIGQALDPVNDLVEQYGSLLLTSTTALGVQRLALQIAKTLGWWLFLPALGALLAALVVGGNSRKSLVSWGRRLFGVALFARLAIPAGAWIDSLVAERFLESNYQQAAAVVSSTTQRIEAVQAEDPAERKAWYERYNPVDYVGEKAKRLYTAIGDVGESIVNLAIYFTISTIILPLGTLWLLSKVCGALFSPRGA